MKLTQPSNGLNVFSPRDYTRSTLLLQQQQRRRQRFAPLLLLILLFFFHSTFVLPMPFVASVLGNDRCCCCRHRYFIIFKLESTVWHVNNFFCYDFVVFFRVQFAIVAHSCSRRTLLSSNQRMLLLLLLMGVLLFHPAHTTKCALQMALVACIFSIKC